MAYDGTLKFDTKIDSSGFEEGLSKIGGLASKGMGAIGGLTKVAAGALAAAGTAAVGFGAAAVKTGAEFEQSMADVAAISGATGDELASLETKALEMGQKTVFSASESAEAFQYMAMAGWKTEDMLGGIEGVMNLAAASGEDLATTSDIVTDALTAFGMSADESSHFADILAATSSNANTNVGMLGESFKYVAPVAGALGMSAEDVSLALGLMANSGIKASQAGTALRSTLTRMAKPTKESQEALDALGISMTDEQGNVKDLNTLMVEMREAFAGCTDAEKAQYAALLAGQEGMSGLLAIVNASDEDWNKLQTAIEGATDETTGYSAAAEMAAKRQDTLQGKIKLLKSAFEALQISMSGSFEGIAKDAVEQATHYIEMLTDAFNEGGFEGLAETGGQILAQILEGIAAKAPAVIETAVQVVHSFCESLQNSESLGENGAALLTAIIDGILSVAGDLANTAVVLLTQLAVGMSEHVGDITDTLATVLQSFFEVLSENGPIFAEAALKIIGNLAIALVEAIPGLVEAAMDIIVGLLDFLVDHYDEFLAGCVELFSALVHAIPQVLDKIYERLPDIIEGIVNFLTDNGPAIFDASLEMLMELVNTIPEIASTVAQHFPEILTAVGEGIAQLLPMAETFFADCIEKTIEFTGDIIEKVGEWGGEMLDYLVENCPEWVEQVVEFFAELPGKLWEKLEEVVEKIVEWGGEMVDNAGEAAEQTIEKIGEFIGELPEKFLEWLDEVIENVVSWGEDLVEKAKEAAEDMAQAIIDAVTDLPGQMLSIGSDIVDGVWEGIKGAGGWFADSVGGFFSGMVSNARSVLGINSPSKVFRDNVGVSIPEGTAAGIKKGMPALMAETEKAMKDLAKEAQSDITANMDGISVGLTGGTAYEQARQDRQAQHDVNVSGTLQSDRPIIVNTTLKVGKKEFAQEIAPEINSALYTIDSRETRGVGR